MFEVISSQNALTIVITLITVLGSTAAWDYYKRRLELNKESESEVNEEKNLYRDDLKDRVKKLEELLAAAALEKDGLRDKVLFLIYFAFAFFV